MLAQGAYAFRKDARPLYLAGSAWAITHLIPEVRPKRANALRCSKTLPAVISTHLFPEVRRKQANALRCSKTLPAFFHGLRCFATGICSHRLSFCRRLMVKTGLLRS